MLNARKARLAGVGLIVLTIGFTVGVPGATGQANTDVVVPRSQPVQVTFPEVLNEGQVFADASESFENAIRMAIEEHPTIRGFPIQLNTVNTSCDGDNTSPATAIVANAQNAAVLGHICSAGFGSALPIYEQAGVVAISGSASSDSLPALGPTVFNRTVVRDGDGVADWDARVSTLPSMLEWQEKYEAEFGKPPFFPSLSALYFDAASLLIKRLQRVSELVDGRLVINRAALAEAVRQTTKYQGVTCVVSLEAATGNRINDQAALDRCAEG